MQVRVLPLLSIQKTNMSYQKEPQAHGIEAIVCSDIAYRQLHGMNKYKVSVADNPLNLRQWLEHAYQETLDEAIYLRRAMDEIDKNKANTTEQDLLRAYQKIGTLQELKAMIGSA